MPFISDEILDNGLNHLTNNANRLDICHEKPENYADAVGSSSLGYSDSITVSSPANRAGGGREVIVYSITGKTVTTSGTATHYSIVDTNNEVLLVTYELTNSQEVIAGNTFNVSSFKIGIPDAA